MAGRTKIGAVALAAYIGCVWAANYFITHVGTEAFPGGPHTIPVGFGYQAPSGVLWVGVALLMRDYVQSLLGRRAVVVGILIGAALSYFIAPAFAAASAVAFLVSEALDFAVYTPLIERANRTKVVRTYHGHLGGAMAARGMTPPDFLVTEQRTPFVDRRYVVAAVVASNVVGAGVDTFLFLWLAFGSIMFWQGQIIGKLIVTAVVVPILALQRHSLAVPA